MMFFHYITYMATPLQENPAPMVMKFTVLPQNNSPWGGLGGMKFTVSCLLTLQMLHTNLVKIGPVVLEKMMLMDNHIIKFPIPYNSCSNLQYNMYYM